MDTAYSEINEREFVFLEELTLKLKTLIILILILSMSLNIILVSAVNFSTFYINEDWYQNLVALLVKFPSLLDENYVEEARSKGEFPSDAIREESENGEIIYYIPYKSYWFNPGDKYNDVIEPYILYVHEKYINISGDIVKDDNCVFFISYKFNETSRKYEFNKRIPMPIDFLNKESNYVNDFSIDTRFSFIYGFVEGNEFIEYAQEIYNSKKQTVADSGTTEGAPDTGNSGIINFVLLILLSGIIFVSAKHHRNIVIP